MHVSSFSILKGSQMFLKKKEQSFTTKSKYLGRVSQISRKCVYMSLWVSLIINQCLNLLNVLSDRYNGSKSPPKWVSNPLILGNGKSSNSRRMKN